MLGKNKKNDISIYIHRYLTASMQYIRINDTYNTLTKTIKHITNTTINIQCCSGNAAICAYNGMKYTIEMIIKQFPHIKLEECIESETYKYFRLKRTIGTTTIIVRKPQQNHKVVLVVNNNMFVY